jgi:hypothetical protein
VIEQARLFLGEDNDPAGPISEPFEQRNTSSSNCGAELPGRLTEYRAGCP